MGFLQLHPSLLYEMTFRELQVMAEGKRKNMEEPFKRDWERARWLATVSIQPHMKKGKRIRPQDLMTFEWERVESNKVITQKDIDELRKFAFDAIKQKQDGEVR